MTQILLILFSLIQNTSSKPTLIYIGDPMCSWCYGIAPELSKVLDHFGDNIDVQLVMGGLRPYNKQTMVDLRDFLTHHWEDVHKASGQRFNYEILSDGSITYDTEPPSRAVIAVRSMDPSQEFPFFKLTQEAFYNLNRNMHLAESYHPILEKLKLDSSRFDALFHSEEMKETVRRDFEKSREMGVSGFPTLILQQGEKRSLISNGYQKADVIIAAIEKTL